MGARHHNTLTRFMKMFYVIDAVNPPMRRGAQSKLIMFKCSREAVRLADSLGGTQHCTLNCGHRIMAITSAFQADDAGSIPADRSSFEWALL